MNWEYFKYYVLGTLLFILVLYVGELLFSRNFARRRRFWLRYCLYAAAVNIISVALTALQYYIERIGTDIISLNVYIFFMYLFMFAAVVASTALCYAEPISKCVNSCILAFICQHIYYGIYSAINTATHFETNILIKIGDYGIFVTSFIQLAMAMLILLSIYTVLNKIIKKNALGALRKEQVLPLVAIALSIVLMLNALSNILTADTVSVAVFAKVLLIVCDACVLTVYVNMLKTTSAQNELAIVAQINEKEHAHFLRLSENMELIEIKCHDIKHYIAAADKSEVDLAELAEQMNIYDTTVKTGNKTLDTLLAERSLFCSAHNITLTVMADASGLDFIGTADMCSIFGNMLENALEAVDKVEAAEKRVVNIKIHPVAGQISVCCENYFADPPNIENGMPVSIKADKSYHGFGVKSIKLAVEKYGGVFSYAIDGDIFRISILFPTQSNTVK